MAKVTITDLQKLIIIALDQERTCETLGILALHKLVSETYSRKYALFPKTLREAEAQGRPQDYDGLKSSCADIQFYTDGGGKTASVHLMPTRYFVGQAYRDVLQEGKFSETEARFMSPRMANVSAIAPVKFGGRYYFVSQTMGKGTTDPGQVISTLAAGQVDGNQVQKAAKDNTHNPFLAALEKECSEEVGLDFQTLDILPVPHAFVEEIESAKINAAYVARGASLDTILKSYAAKRNFKEVQAIALVPAETSTLRHVNAQELANIPYFSLTDSGIQESRRNVVLRPYTLALLEHISDERQCNTVLELAGH